MSEIFNSAAYRIAFIYSVIIALAIILLGTAFNLSFHSSLLSQLEGRITNEVIELTAKYVERGMPALKAEIQERESLGISRGLGYALFSETGTRIAGNLNTKLSTTGIHGIRFIDQKGSSDIAWANVSMLDTNLILIVAADLEPVEQAEATIFSLSLAALGGVLLIGLAGGLILGLYLQRRLGAINLAALAIMGGDMSQRMILSPNNDEFDRLSATLNAMLDRINILLENLRQVSSDLAHDLRTPLSRLHNRLQMALIAKQDLPLMKNAVGEALAQVDELLTLFSAILRISEIESGRIRHSFGYFDLTDLLDDLCQSFAPAFEDGEHLLSWKLEPNINLYGDRELIAQAVVNLLENAQKHTAVGTTITVRLLSFLDSIRLTVADNGLGVSEQDRERITRRFVRLEQARTTPGNGLGLNLVRAITDLHHARLTFSDNRPGLLVSIDLPNKKKQLD